MNNNFLLFNTKYLDNANKRSKKTFETLAVKLKRSFEEVHFVILLRLEEEWMTVLSDLEVYNYIFNKTKEKIILIIETKRIGEIQNLLIN